MLFSKGLRSFISFSRVIKINGAVRRLQCHIVRNAELRNCTHFHCVHKECQSDLCAAHSDTRPFCGHYVMHMNWVLTCAQTYVSAHWGLSSSRLWNHNMVNYCGFPIFRMQFSWQNCFCWDCIAVPKISKRLGFEGIKSQKDNKEPNVVVLYAPLMPWKFSS